MRTNLYFAFRLALFSLIPVSFLGCASHNINSEMPLLKPAPEGFPGIRVSLENIRFYVSHVPPQVQTGMGFNAGAGINGGIVTPSIVVTQGDPKDATLIYNIAAERRLYDALTQLSVRNVSSSSRSGYELEPIEVMTRFPDQKVAEVVAVRTMSFFVPPMANVKTELECPYEVGYALRKDGKIIHEFRMKSVIKGDYKGWYIVAQRESNRLTEELNGRVIYDIAVNLLNDMYRYFEKENIKEPSSQ